MVAKKIGLLAQKSTSKIDFEKRLSLEFLKVKGAVCIEKIGKRVQRIDEGKQNPSHLSSCAICEGSIKKKTVRRL